MKILREEVSLMEMSQVASMEGEKFNACIWVHPDKNRNGSYFKIYDAISIKSAKKIARINFHNANYEYHRDEMGKKAWKLTSSEIMEIIDFLNSPYEEDASRTNWDQCKWIWNRDMFGLYGIKIKFKEYMAGGYDEDPPIPEHQFIRFDHKIPDYAYLK